MNYKELLQNEEVKVFLTKGNANLGILGYTDHSEKHCAIVAKRAGMILEKFGYSKHEIELAEFVLERKEDCKVLVEQQENGTLPIRVTHNDTKLNNILFDADTGKGLCIIDLDTIMPGLAANDFGDSIRFGAATAEEDEKDLSKMHFDISLYELYAKGYLEETRDVLTPEEAASLAWGARLMTFECGMRFLTDYLQGDTYFKTAYPEHNLVRARTQFRLVDEMEQQFDQMIEIVAKYYRGLGR